jgi:hypothetical protein
VATVLSLCPAVFIPVAREEMLAKLAAGYGDLAGTMIVPREQQAAQVDYTVPLIPEAPGVGRPNPYQDSRRRPTINGMQLTALRAAADRRTLGGARVFGNRPSERSSD